MSEKRCPGLNDRSYWWGVDYVDPHEPGYVAGKGIFCPAYLPCCMMPDESGFCPKHRTLLEMYGRVRSDQSKFTDPWVTIFAPIYADLQGEPVRSAWNE